VNARAPSVAAAARRSDLGDQLARHSNRSLVGIATVVRLLSVCHRDAVPASVGSRAQATRHTAASGLATRSHIGRVADGWRLAERMPCRGWLGVTLGIAGACVIAAPSLRAETPAQLLGCAALLIAAMAWAISIVYVRSHSFRASPLVLAPWQSLVAMVLLLPCAMLLEGEPSPIGLSAALSLGYVGPIATAFAYWAMVEAGSRLRASTVSMALLATPPLGIAISVWTMHETLDRSLLGGVLLITLGIVLSVPRSMV
jgi:drug/metabolite transporter (DMT)-like permease